MAYRCTYKNKILVGPKKTCENCEYKPGDCGYRVWQDGVLKEGGKRARKERSLSTEGTGEKPPTVFALDTSDFTGSGETYLHYLLGGDENYHFYGDSPEGLIVLPVLTKEDLNFARKNKWSYAELFKHKAAQRLK